jgi:hypothetical protein
MFGRWSKFAVETTTVSENKKYSKIETNAAQIEVPAAANHDKC